MEKIMNQKNLRCLLIILNSLFLPATFLWAQDQLSKYVLSNGGETSYHADIKLNSTIGQTIVGISTSNSDSCKMGFWYLNNVTPVHINHFEYLSPVRYQLFQNYPNPFNPRTIISWQLAIGGHVDLSIYNILGKKITTLISEELIAGNHTTEWDASKLSSGIYYYRIKTGKFQEFKRMILLK